jgi:hypothetical protein
MNPIEELFENAQNGSMKSLFILGVLVLLISTVCLGGLFIIGDNVQTTQTLALLGESTTEIQDSASVISYEQLNEPTQDRFREVQSSLYNNPSVNEEQYLLSTNADQFANSQYIQLDGVYYQLDLIERPSIIGVVLISLGISIGMGMLFGVFSIGVAVTDKLVAILVSDVSLQTVKALAVIFILLSTSIGAVVSISGPLQYGEYHTIERTDITEETEVTSFEELSNANQQAFVSAVSSSTTGYQNSLEDGMVVRSDGEVYEIVQNIFLPHNIIFAIAGGILGVAISLPLSMKILQKKTDGEMSIQRLLSRRT